MSSEGEGVWSPTNGFAYIAPFTLAAGDTTLNVVLQAHLGGQAAMGADNNPILQAFTVTEVTIPPTPEDLALSPREFFVGQRAPVGTFATTDLKRSATHLYSLAEGFGDQDKFLVEDDQLLPDERFDFSAYPAGATFTVRARTTDAEDPTRFLERDFTLTLAQALAPDGLALNASSISSGAIAGTPAGRFTTSDGNAVDAHTYALVAGEGDADNGMFGIDGEWLRVAAPIPAGRVEVTIRARATDLSGLTFEKSFTLAVTDPSLRINEAMASNGATLTDEDGAASDWIEIFNEQAGAANLNGWYLTDDPDNLTQWRIPAVTIPANGFLVVFASGKDRAPTNGGNLHTNFQLAGTGEYLALVEPDGVTVASQLEFPESFTDVSYGHNAAATETGFLRSPSPGAANGETAAQIVNAVAFSHGRGLYDAAFDLTLSPTIAGSVIRYTTNGEKPTPSSGSIYSGPIPVTPETAGNTRGTRRIRAIAIDPAAAFAPVATHTYVWVNGTSSPLTNGVVGQSVFQASIKNHATYGPIMDDGLLALPVVSIVKSGGVSASEQETSIELISNDGSEPGFQIDCGIKIVGGASTGSPKNNFRCYFRSDYGTSSLRYPVFAGEPYTTGASEVFDVLQLRGGSHDNFYWMALPSNPPIALRHGDAQYVRNRWVSDMEMLMGHTSLHGRYVHCYLNGVYHGLYHLHERPMHHYMDKYFGGDAEDYHYTNSGRTGSDHGGGDTWLTTWNQVRAAASAGGQQSRDWINWASLADNQLLYYYCGNDWDWTTQHNWMAAGPKEPGKGGWRFYSWDCDVMLYDIVADNLDQNAPDGVFTSLMNDVDFRVYFRDRIYKHCYHGGVLSPGGPQAAHDYRINEIFEAIVPETARWQPSSATSLPWDRDGEWTVEWDYMRDVYWPQRTPILISQLRARGWYPVDAPEFDPHGGQVESGFSPLITSGAGTVYVTTDGSDPRLPGGAINPAAMAVNGSSATHTILPAGAIWKYLDNGSNQGTAWRAMGFDDSGWSSGPAEFGYGDGGETTVVGFGANAADKHITTYFRRTFEVEDAATVNGLILRLLRDDGGVVYLNGTEVWRSAMPTGAIDSETLASSGAAGADETTFFVKTDVSPGVLVEGTNTVAVEIHQSAASSSDLSFNFELAVVKPADPSQFSLSESAAVSARVLQGNEWSAINTVRYTIGAPADATNLVVSEFSYRPAGPGAGENPGGLYSATDFEFIEVRNISQEVIHLDGVRITDGVDFDFSDASVFGLAPGETLLVVESRDAFLARYPGVSPGRIAGEYRGNLSNDGERIEVLAADGSVIREFIYNDKVPWPEAADGEGYTLELIDPGSNPDHAVATNWRASRGIHGTPAGQILAFTFAQWQTLNFTAAELALPAVSGPDADKDGDTWSTFAEFALGTAPGDPLTRNRLPEVALEEIGGDEYLALSYDEWAGASGITYTVEVGTDLLTWPGTTVEVGAPRDNGDGTVTRRFRSATPISAGTGEFIRLKMSE